MAARWHAINDWFALRIKKADQIGRRVAHECYGYPPYEGHSKVRYKNTLRLYKLTVIPAYKGADTHCTCTKNAWVWNLNSWEE